MRRLLALVLAACAAHGSPPRTESHVARPTKPALPAVDPSGDWEVRWDRTFANWKPPLFEGAMTLTRTGDTWTGSLGFMQSSSNFTFESAHIDGERVELVFQGDKKKAEISGWLRDGRFVGEMRWAHIGWTPLSARRAALPKLVDGHVDHSLPPGDPDRANLDKAALAALVWRGELERTSAIVIVRDGKVVVEKYRDDAHGEPVMAMSASKSITSLAIGLLIADGKLKETTRMGELFPEWKDPKGAITVRQMLSHTSGLDPTRAAFTSNETIRAHALAAKVLYAPGSRFQYNNDAVDFLAVVAAKAAGMPFDAFVQKRIFEPLDVQGASWMKDSEGTARAAGELMIRPVDLAKIGQMMLDDGKWNGAQIVAADWVHRSVDAGQSFDESCGLLWWREGTFAHALTEPVIAGWHDAGVEEATLRAGRALIGTKFKSRQELSDAFESGIGKPAKAHFDNALFKSDHVPFDALVSDGPTRGFAARGWLGQFLIVLPASHVVAVRMRRMDARDESESAERNGYRTFADDLARVVSATARESSCAGSDGRCAE